MSSRAAFFVFLVALAVACGGAARYVEPAAKMTCILLRAVTTDGTVDEICATAEELAPFVPELIATRAESGGPTPSRAFVAYSLDAPVTPVSRRRCVAWKILPDRGEVDGGR